MLADKCKFTFALIKFYIKTKGINFGLYYGLFLISLLLYAYAIDNAGRKQYFYTKKYTEKTEGKKFNNLLIAADDEANKETPDRHMISDDRTAEIFRNSFEDSPGFLKENCGILKNMKLKTVAKAMKNHGHIKSDWDDEMTNGMEANMVIIRGLQERLPRFADFAGIDRLIHYNMIDCATLYEIVKYLRQMTLSFEEKR